MPRRSFSNSDDEITRALQQVRGGNAKSVSVSGHGRSHRFGDMGDINALVCRTIDDLYERRPESTRGIFADAKVKAALRLKFLDYIEIVMTGQNAITRAYVTERVVEIGLQIAEQINDIWRKFWLKQAPAVRKAIETELANYADDLLSLRSRQLPQELWLEGIVAFDEVHYTAMAQLRHQIVFDQNGYMQDARALGFQAERRPTLPLPPTTAAFPDSRYAEDVPAEVLDDGDEAANEA